MYSLDVKGIMEKFIPNIFHFIELEPHAELIQRKLNKKLEARLSMVDRGYDPYEDGDFYDLLYLTTKIGDGITDKILVRDMVNILLCYDAMFQSLNARLTPIQKLFLKDTVLKILRNANNQYIHYIGELLALDTTLRSDFILNEAAVQLGNKKDAEYSITDIRNGQTYFYEVYNIRITRPDAKEVKAKLKWKLNNKLKDGVDDSNFILQPVVWCKSFEDMKVLAQNIADWKDYHFDDRVIEPFALFMISTKSGFPRFEFTGIKKLLTGFTEENAL